LTLEITICFHSRYPKHLCIYFNPLAANVLRLVHEIDSDCSASHNDINNDNNLFERRELLL